MPTPHRFSTTLASLALGAACLISALPAAAQSTADKAGATPIDGDSVYKAFHEKAGITRIVDDFIGRVTTDERIKDHFADIKLDHLKAMLVEQFVYLTGGGGTYTGRDMKSVHAGMDLRERDFNALAEDLQLAMDKEGVPFSAQNRLVAKLAPMEHVIVTK